jgi:hypothetical protein
MSAESTAALGKTRATFFSLHPRCIPVGNSESMRLDDIERVKQLAPESRVVYFPNGLFGDVAIIAESHEDLISIAGILIKNDVKYAVFFAGAFEAGNKPGPDGRLTA